MGEICVQFPYAGREAGAFHRVCPVFKGILETLRNDDAKVLDERLRGVAVQEKLYVGVDLHKTQFTICVINEEGDSFEAGTKFPMDKEGYIAFAD